MGCGEAAAEQEICNAYASGRDVSRPLFLLLFFFKERLFDVTTGRKRRQRVSDVVSI
jgi:hypothetical protein